MSKHSSLVLCLRNTHKDPVKQEVLLVCDSPSIKSDLKPAWRWGLPGGKCCDDKLTTRHCCEETPEETAIREMLEETGYRTEVELLFSDERMNQESREKFIRFVFRGTIIGGTKLQKNLPSGLVCAVSPAWFKLGDFPRNSHYSHQEIIKRYFGL